MRKPTTESDGKPKLSKASIKYTYEGDLEGERLVGNGHGSTSGEEAEYVGPRAA